MATGNSANTVALKDARRDLERKQRGRNDTPPEKPRNGILPNQKNRPPNWTPNDDGLPSEVPCPVQCLGVEGEIKHLIDSDGQFRSWTKGDFNQAGISDLFSATPNYPKWAWPRHGRGYKIKDEDGSTREFFPIESFKADDVRDALFLACSRAGMFSPTDKLRGRGMWLNKAGQLVYHAGEELWEIVEGKPKAKLPGIHEKLLYPRLPELPAPWPEPIGVAGNPAGVLLSGFRRWVWRRPEVDPVLLLGWIGVAFLGGALKWRPAALLLGDRETGKSTLQTALNNIFGEALFHASDTTAAGIYNSMRQDARPIALDELEPGANPEKVQNVVQLMRNSASGAIGRRSTSDGAARQFQMSSAFLFSAINNPVNSSQDLSRLAVLRLMPLPKEKINQVPLVVDVDTCGRSVLAILMREWPRFAATLDFYKHALAAGGHTNRGQDTYGTLLAAADLLLGPELADELGVPMSLTLEGQENSAAAAFWARELAAESLPEVEDALPNWRKCAETLFTVAVDQWRGGSRPSIGRVLADLEEGQRDPREGLSYPAEDARRDLGDAGLGLESATDVLTRYVKNENARLTREGLPPTVTLTDAKNALGLAENDGWLLAVPNEHPQVKKLFRESDWANGSWADALRQCPIQGVMISDRAINRVGIAGVQKRCTLIVLKRFHASPER